MGALQENTVARWHWAVRDSSTNDTEKWLAELIYTDPDGSSNEPLGFFNTKGDAVRHIAKVMKHIRMAGLHTA